MKNDERNQDFDTNGEKNDELVDELISNVKIAVQSFKFDELIERITEESLQKSGLKKDEFLRRSFDGNSEVSWLVRKMIGEFLSEGKIKR
ncbi:hypothetical protein [Bdellovibrio sp. BCCA]|uniref:hypothetical protein n=1 Tax=Bdellovibrio sp. BCCA TaxID=3136281 RepID=UPI0030F0C186